MRDGRDDVPAQLAVFATILLLEAEALFLRQVGAAEGADLVEDVEEDFFGATVAVLGVVSFADVAARDVCDAVGREANAVGDLLAPTVGVKAGVVPGFLAGVDVNPALLHLGVHLCPDVVFGVPDPADAAADRAAEHAEAVGPFTAAAATGLH